MRHIFVADMRNPRVSQYTEGDLTESLPAMTQLLPSNNDLHQAERKLRLMIGMIPGGGLISSRFIINGNISGVGGMEMNFLKTVKRKHGLEIGRPCKTNYFEQLHRQQT